MHKRKWLIAAAIVLAAAACWQIWETQRPSLTMTDGRLARQSGKLHVAAPAAEDMPEALPVIDLTTAFTIVPPPMNGDADPTRSEPASLVELLPPPRPTMDEADATPATEVVPASFRPHAAESSNIEQPRTSIWKKLVRFLLGGSMAADSPPLGPDQHLDPAPKLAHPDPYFETLWEQHLADIARRKQFQMPHTHPGCPFQGGCPYDGSHYRFAKPDAKSGSGVHDPSKVQPPAPSDLRKSPKLDTLEIRPGDLPRSWFIRPF